MDERVRPGRSTRWRVAPALVMGFGVLATAVACGADPRPRPPSDYECSPTSFEQAAVEAADGGGSAPRWNLTVSGAATGPVYLLPVTYVRQPEYWRIDVAVCTPPGVGIPQVVRPYSLTIDLTGVLGTKGVEVVGQDRSVRLDVPPGPA